MDTKAASHSLSSTHPSSYTAQMPVKECTGNRCSCSVGSIPSVKAGRASFMMELNAGRRLAFIKPNLSRRYLGRASKLSKANQGKKMRAHQIFIGVVAKASWIVPLGSMPQALAIVNSS